MARNHGFELVLDVPANFRTDEEVADAVYDAGCCDCLVVVRNGDIILEFDRNSKSRKEAIDSAIKQLEKFGLKATLKRGKPVNPRPSVRATRLEGRGGTSHERQDRCGSRGRGRR